MLKTISKQDLKSAIEQHELWLVDSAKGKRLELVGYDLRYSDLRLSNLSYSDLSYSDLSYSNLRYSNLSNSDLDYSNLSNVKLWDTIGNNRNIVTIQTMVYIVTYTSTVLQIGCEQHPIADWWGFDDVTIDKMDSKALGWWKVWKPLLQFIIAENPAKPTGHMPE